MSKPVYRYMKQKEFEKAPKSKLMERLTQMNVIPDVLAPNMNPTVEVSVKVAEGQVEPGVFLKPEQVILKKNRHVFILFYIHAETYSYRASNFLKLISPTSTLNHDYIP